MIQFLPQETLIDVSTTKYSNAKSLYFGCRDLLKYDHLLLQEAGHCSPHLSALNKAGSE